MVEACFSSSLSLFSRWLNLSGVKNVGNNSEKKDEGLKMSFPKEQNHKDDYFSAGFLADQIICHYPETALSHYFLAWFWIILFLYILNTQLKG